LVWVSLSSEPELLGDLAPPTFIEPGFLSLSFITFALSPRDPVSRLKNPLYEADNGYDGFRFHPMEPFFG
jgi:hypothetical protein